MVVGGCKYIYLLAEGVVYVYTYTRTVRYEVIDTGDRHADERIHWATSATHTYTQSHSHTHTHTHTHTHVK